MDNKKKPQKKYVSVRKALRELRVGEGELKKIIEQGGIKAYPEEGSKVKFDADEIKKYQTSQIQKQEEEPIADESLYLSEDGSLEDSLFKTQVGGKKGSLSLTEEIPHEADISSGPSGSVPFQKKQNLREFLSKKKAKPVSPVKAIYGGKIQGKPPLVLYFLFMIIIIIISMNTYFLLQGNTNSLNIKTSKVINDELEPSITILSTIVPVISRNIISPIDGFVKNVYYKQKKKEKKNNRLFNIENISKGTINKEILVFQKATFELELEKKRIKKLPLKMQEKIEQISKKYHTINANISQVNVKKWQQNIQQQTRNKKYDAKVIQYWIHLQIAHLKHEIARTEWERVKKQYSSNIVIKTPFDGMVNITYAGKANKVRQGDILAEYTSTATQLEAKMSQKEYAQIDIDKAVIITLPNGDNEKGKILQTSVKNDEVSIRIYIKTSLAVGIKMKATFLLQTIPECILVPKEAIFFKADIRGNNQAMVCKVIKKLGKKQVFPVPVVVGKFDADFVQILMGLEAGDLVITGGSQPLELFVYEQFISQ